MLGLIPRDHWEHRLSDVYRGLIAALATRKRSEGLFLDGLGGCIPVQSGRAALVAAIKALGLPAGAHVGVPLFCCHVVFKAIAAAGCLPCFIDVEPETFCMSSEDLQGKRSNVDAVIAVHMFGNLCDVPQLKEAAPGIPVIEDCAQALGSELHGRPAGSLGDVSFFSFRSGKYLSVGEGGALFSADKDICSRASDVVSAMPAPSIGEESLHVAKVYVKSLLRSRPLYGLVGYSLWTTLGRGMNLSERSAVDLGQIYNSDQAIVRKRLQSLKSVIERQRDNAGLLLKTLKLEPSMLCAERPGTFYNRYHFPITFPSQEARDLIADYLHKRKIDTIRYLDDIVDIARRQFGYAGGCGVAESLSKRVLIIPSYYSLKANEIERIATCVDEGWLKASRRFGHRAQQDSS